MEEETSFYHPELPESCLYGISSCDGQERTGGTTTTSTHVKSEQDKSKLYH
jgi:hypothetical protein